jgi:hypothetical protein
VTSRLGGSTLGRLVAGALGLLLLAPAMVALAQPAEWPLTVATIAGTVELSRKRAPWARAALRDTVGATDSARAWPRRRVGRSRFASTPAGSGWRCCRCPG